MYLAYRKRPQEGGVHPVVALATVSVEEPSVLTVLVVGTPIPPPSSTHGGRLSWVGGEVLDQLSESIAVDNGDFDSKGKCTARRRRENMSERQVQTSEALQAHTTCN
jgi:hypothetical protein